MAWAESERRELFHLAVPWAGAPRAHLLALSSLRALAGRCRWMDACAELERNTKGWNPVPAGGSAACTVRMGLPIDTLTPGVLGQCAMALHVVAVTHASLHPCPELPFFLAMQSRGPVAGALAVSTDSAARAGTGPTVYLAYALEPNEPCPFLASLSCLETRLRHRTGLVRSYHAEAAHETSVPLWRVRTLLTGVARFLVSARKHAKRSPEADALLVRWADVLDSLVPDRPAGVSAAALLASDADRLSAAQWEALAKRQEALCPCGATGTLFHAELTTYARAFAPGSDYCVSAEALLRLGWCAVAASTGKFRYTTLVEPGTTVFRCAA